MLRGCVITACAAALGACSGEQRVDGGGVGDGSSRCDSCGDVGTDGDGAGGDAASSRRPGTVTLVATEVEIVTDRICDLDGDEVGDNAIADLGSPAGALFAGALNSGDLEAERRRTLVHMPCLEDVVGPNDEELTLAMIVTHDSDDPRNPEDDFSGAETFLAVAWSNLDGCGEPSFLFPGARVDDGTLAEVEGRGFVPLFGEWLSLEVARISGHVDGHGDGAQLSVCGVRSVSTVDNPDSSPDHLPAGLTTLEALLAGGGATGFEIPGLSPDIDVDGDGLERLELDEEWHIERCVDGDGTVIEGRDCFADARMADGISFAFRMEMTSAVLGGRVPGYEGGLWGECAAPPERSYFDPCE